MIAPAAQLSNVWDSRLGGALADAVGANAVVKAFGVEAREDARLGRLLAKWNRRTHRTWMRITLSITAQFALLLTLRTAIVGTALSLRWTGAATSDDVVYVLTTDFVVHGYLRDTGGQINRLQREVNEMEELVTLDADPYGVADRPEATPLAARGGDLRFEHVTFHDGGHATPLYCDLSVHIPVGQRVGLVGRSGSAKPPS